MYIYIHVCLFMFVCVFVIHTHTGVDANACMHLFIHGVFVFGMQNVKLCIRAACMLLMILVLLADVVKMLPGQV